MKLQLRKHPETDDQRVEPLRALLQKYDKSRLGYVALAVLHIAVLIAWAYLFASITRWIALHLESGFWWGLTFGFIFGSTLGFQAWHALHHLMLAPFDNERLLVKYHDELATIRAACSAPQGRN